MRELFQLFDANDSGAISVHELSVGLTKYLGWRPTRFESEKIFELVDTSGNGTIDLGEFVEMLSMPGSSYTKSLTQIKSQLQQLQALFTMFDVNGDGVLDFQISFDHMNKVLSALGETWPEEEVEKMCEDMSKALPAASFRSFCEVSFDMYLYIVDLASCKCNLYSLTSTATRF